MQKNSTLSSTSRYANPVRTVSHRIGAGVVSLALVAGLSPLAGMSGSAFAEEPADATATENTAAATDVSNAAASTDVAAGGEAAAANSASAGNAAAAAGDAAVGDSASAAGGNAAPSSANATSGADGQTPPDTTEGTGGPGSSAAPGGSGGSGESAAPGGSGAPGGPGGADTMNFDYSGTYAGTVTADGTSVESSEDQQATDTDVNVGLAQNSGQLTILGGTLSKSGDDTDGDRCNFYGANSIVLAVGEGSQATVSGTQLNATSAGSNGLFATDAGTVWSNENTIATTADNSRGLDATYGGTIIANDTTIETQGEHCAGVATDRGGGSISVANSIITTAGSGSPIVYSTGDIEISNVEGSATGSQLVGMEGKNSVLIENSKLTSTVTGKTASDPIADGVIIYQSTSGDAEASTGEAAQFTAVDSTLSSAIESGSMFYLTNTQANVVLQNTELDFDSNAANLIVAAGNNSNNWGRSGSNGAQVVFTGIDQELEGDVEVDSISSIDLYLTDNSTWTGTAAITEYAESENTDAAASGSQEQAAPTGDQTQGEAADAQAPGGADDAAPAEATGEQEAAPSDAQAQGAPADQGGTPPAMPEGQAPGDGDTPPAMPEGQTPGDGDTPPAMPEGQGPGGGGTPPAMPDGQAPGDGGTPPAMPDGQAPSDGGTPPAMPEGQNAPADNQNAPGEGGTPPAMPEGQDSASQTQGQDGSEQSTASSDPLTVNVDATSTWVVTDNATVTNLNVADGGKVVDAAGKAVNIVANGQTVVQGESELTVTVEGSFGTTVALSEANSVDEGNIDRTAFDNHFGTSTQFAGSDQAAVTDDQSADTDNNSTDTTSSEAGNTEGGVQGFFSQIWNTIKGWLGL